MGRRTDARSDPVDGVLLLNKPAGLTSNQALQKVKRLLNARKAGHTGSLDPAATGMLPLCFGEATKVCAFLLEADKTYRVTARLGVATDTGDADGSEIARSDVMDLSAEQWSALLESFKGDSTQVPPMYSALKKDGKRLYELARKGETVARDPRPVRISAIELLEIAGNRLVFRVCCSKGTYVRVLVEDIAAKAGMLAHTARLHRENVAGFESVDMLDLGGLEEDARTDRAALLQRLLPPDSALQNLPEVRLERQAAERFCAGQQIATGSAGPAGLVRVYAREGEFMGVGELSVIGELAPKRVFHMGEKIP
ncbi:MAG: tRNA pseudouridine(55) synthase TruB [Gammaproteobacteria bacterium]|nr:tRNA pseudouridine(55) synthase TruB [Gammaproteobacteria bacterium]